MPLWRSAAPHGSVPITFTTQEVSGPAGTGAGGPKKQFASSWQLLFWPPQSASEVHAARLVLAQCFPGPAPSVQVSGPVPLLAASVSCSPLAPETSRIEVEPSGSGVPGKVRALPPPMYRHPSPRSFSLVPVPSSISPENGATELGLSPGPPQSVVP